MTAKKRVTGEEFSKILKKAIKSGAIIRDDDYELIDEPEEKTNTDDGVNVPEEIDAVRGLSQTGLADNVQTPINKKAKTATEQTRANDLEIEKMTTGMAKRFSCLLKYLAFASFIGGGCLGYQAYKENKQLPADAPLLEQKAFSGWVTGSAALFGTAFLCAVAAVKNNRIIKSDIDWCKSKSRLLKDMQHQNGGN